MTAANAHGLLVVSRHGPYDGQRARSALELALAAAAFDRDVALLLLGNGVRQLQSAQSTPAGKKNHGKMMASLPLYDMEQVYVDATALAANGITPMAGGPDVVQLTPDEIRALCDSCEQVLTL